MPATDIDRTRRIESSRFIIEGGAKKENGSGISAGSGLGRAVRVGGGGPRSAQVRFSASSRHLQLSDHDRLQQPELAMEKMSNPGKDDHRNRSRAGPVQRRRERHDIIGLA